MRLRLGLGPVQLGTLERLLIVGVGNVCFVPAVFGELGVTSAADGLLQLRVGHEREELERRRRPPLLTHEDHRRVGGAQHECSAAGQQARGQRGRDAVASGTVTHLVVVLQVADELPTG